MYVKKKNYPKVLKCDLKPAESGKESTLGRREWLWVAQLVFA